MLRPVLFNTMGGTIHADKYGNTAPDVATFKTAAKFAPVDTAKQIAANSGRTLIVNEVAMEDSKFITEKHMQDLAAIINLSEHDLFTVTFGTDDAVKWGKYLEARIHRPDEKTVLFITAMWPMANGAKSDGTDNIVYTLEKIDTCPRGVSIVGKMADGKPGIIGVNKVQKNFEKKIFEPIDASKIRHK